MKNVKSINKTKVLLLLVMVEIMLIQIGCLATPLNFASPTLGDPSEKRNLMGLLTKYVFNAEAENGDTAIDLPLPVYDSENFNNGTVNVCGQKMFANENVALNVRSQATKKDQKSHSTGIDRFKKFIRYFNPAERNKNETGRNGTRLVQTFIKTIKPVRDMFFPFLSQKKLEDGLREKQKQIINQMIQERKQKELNKLNSNRTVIDKPEARIMDYTEQMEKKTVLNTMKNELLKPTNYEASKIPPSKFKYAKPSNFLNYPDYYYYPEQPAPNPTPYYDETPPSNLMFYDEEPQETPEAESRLSAAPVQSETYRTKNEEIKTSIYY